MPLVVLTGLPGSGKSGAAKTLQEAVPGSIIISEDSLLFNIFSCYTGIHFTDFCRFYRRKEQPGRHLGCGRTIPDETNDGDR